MRKVSLTGWGLKAGEEIVCLDVGNSLNPNVRWVTNYRVEAAGFHNGGKFVLPLERVDPELFCFVEHAELFARVKVVADEGVAALDVVAEVGEGGVEGLIDGGFKGGSVELVVLGLAKCGIGGGGFPGLFEGLA